MKLLIYVLNKIWAPEINHKFSIISNTFRKYKKRNLKFQYSCLMQFSWLSYSAIQDGAFCKFCVAFLKSHGGLNSQILGSLLFKQFNNWKHAVETFT